MASHPESNTASFAEKYGAKPHEHLAGCFTVIIRGIEYIGDLNTLEKIAGEGRASRDVRPDWRKESGEPGPIKTYNIRF